MTQHKQIIFDPFRLDLTDERLFRGDQEIDLRGKAFAVLQYLAERPNQLVTKKELFETFWSDSNAGEEGLTKCISDIRVKLGDDPDNPQIIQTRHRRGYSFIAPTQKNIEAHKPHQTETFERKIVVGHRHGKELNMTSITDLHSLASPNARSLMELADLERFAVDDCILLTNSKDFQGWEPEEIKTTLITEKLPIPPDLEKLKQEKLPAIEKDYFNCSLYRLASFTPALSDVERLEVTLAPIGFHDYYSLSPFFDEPVLEGSISVRQKYAGTVLAYSSFDRAEVSSIPTPVCIQGVILTADQQIILMQRSSAVAFYPNHWSASFEENMNAPGLDRRGRPTRMGDTDFLDTAYRGLEEEFAVNRNEVESLKVISLNTEYLTLSLDVIVVATVSLAGEEVRKRWLVEAQDRDEASRFDLVSASLDAIVEKLFSQPLWHPTARMRLIQFLFHTYGVKAVAAALRESSQ